MMCLMLWLHKRDIKVLDLMAMEAFINGGLRLHLSLFCTFCFRHQCLPQTFMDITLVLLVKGGNLEDISNYRSLLCPLHILVVIRNIRHLPCRKPKVALIANCLIW